jgi:DNA replication initiation complex subunit (GINS family)
MTTDDISNSMQMPLLTFNSLYGLLREEKKSRGLQLLPEKFYEGVTTFLENKKKEISRLKDNKELDKLSKENRVYENSKKIIEELIVLRLSKISSMAIRNSFYEDHDSQTKEVLDKEQDYFEIIVKDTKSLMKGVL